MVLSRKILTWAFLMAGILPALYLGQMTSSRFSVRIYSPIRMRWQVFNKPFGRPVEVMHLPKVKIRLSDATKVIVAFGGKPARIDIQQAPPSFTQWLREFSSGRVNTKGPPLKSSWVYAEIMIWRIQEICPDMKADRGVLASRR